MVIVACGRLSFGALKLPKAVENSSKTCDFQEEIQCHKAMSMRGKKKSQAKLLSIITQRKKGYIVTVGKRIWALIDNKLNTAQYNLQKGKDCSGQGS